MLAPEAAWQRIAERISPLGVERRERSHALGARLAEELFATDEVPACDVSAMDGFALAGEAAPGCRLPIAGIVAAGDAPGAVLAEGTALRIWTGAPVPVGADRVVPVEQTREHPGEPSEVELREPIGEGAHIRRRGEILRAGQRLLAAGSRLGPACLALLASQGASSVAVSRRPRVAILPTGDEVVPADNEPGPGQLRDSHTDYLRAAVGRLGIEPTCMAIAGDDAEELTENLARALEDHDVVLVCGGVSMGGRDHSETAIERAGLAVVFHGVAIQPGKPLVFATREQQYVFGLPGNPASVMVSFRLFVRPALERMAGGDAVFWSDARTVELVAPLAAGKARDRFVPGRRRGTGERGFELVEPLGVRGSHDLATFGEADRLLRVPAHAPALEAGAAVEAIVWD